MQILRFYLVGQRYFGTHCGIIQLLSGALLVSIDSQWTCWLMITSQSVFYDHQSANLLILEKLLIYYLFAELNKKKLILFFFFASLMSQTPDFEIHVWFYMAFVKLHVFERKSWQQFCQLRLLTVNVRNTQVYCKILEIYNINSNFLVYLYHKKSWL